MSHYYKNDETLDHNLKTIHLNLKNTSLTFVTDLGVFSKSNVDYGTQVLLENIELPDKDLTVIDMGCGYGPIGLYIAKTYPKTRVKMIDVNERALHLAKKNSHMNAVHNVEIEHGFLFEKVNQKVDIVVTNPPIRAGKQTVFTLYEQAYQWLKSGGLLYVVIQKKQGAPSSKAKLDALFGNTTILDKNKGYWILLAKK